MSAWIGPVVIAALIAALVQLLVLLAQHRRERSRSLESRRERIIDVQTAIRAEIRSHRHRLLQFAEVQRAGSAIPAIGASFQPFIPGEVRPFVLEAILKDIHILPTDVIDPVIVYYRQVLALIQLVEDLRSDRFRELTIEQRLAIYGDYIAMGAYASDLAQSAIAAIERDLGVKTTLNNSDADPSDPKSGGVAQAAREGVSET